MPYTFNIQIEHPSGSQLNVYRRLNQKGAILLYTFIQKKHHSASQLMSYHCLRTRRALMPYTLYSNNALLALN